MRKRLGGVAAVVLAGVVGLRDAAAAPGFGFGAEVRNWWVDLEGDFKVDQTGVPGTNIDVEDDLDVDTSKTVVEPEIWFRIFSNRFNFSAVNLNYSGSGVLSRSIVFNGKTYTANSTVDSRLDLSIIDGTYERPIPFIGSWGPVSLNILLGGKLLDFDGEIEAPGTGRAEESVQAPVPQVGLALRGDVSLVEFYAGVKGVAIDVSEVSGSMIDARAAVGIGRFFGFGIHGGYRYLGFEIESDDIEIDLVYSGPYVSADWIF